MKRLSIYNGAAPKRVDQIPEHLQPAIKAVVEQMKKRHPICCLWVDVDESSHTIIANTCIEYVEEKVRFRFETKKNGSINLTMLPPASLEEEVQQAAVSITSADHNPVVREKIIDEKNGIAFFILFEILEKGVLGHTGPRGIQERYTLYSLIRGKKPEVLCSDHAYIGTPEYPGRVCVIKDLTIEAGKVRVKHYTSKTYSDDPPKAENFVFDIKGK